MTTFQRNKEYRYDYHEISVAIYEWAESQICRPHLDRQYFDDQLAEAMEKIKQIDVKQFGWLPVYETYKGGSWKKKGWVYVAVRMPNGQDYGFYARTKARADDIYRLLEKLWREYYGLPVKEA